jgi:hypothetical protein
MHREQSLRPLDLVFALRGIFQIICEKSSLWSAIPNFRRARLLIDIRYRERLNSTRRLPGSRRMAQRRVPKIFLAGWNLIATFFGRSAATNKHPAAVIVMIVVTNAKHSKGCCARIEHLLKLIADHNCHRLMGRGWWHRGLTNLLRERWRGGQCTGDCEERGA